MAILTKQQRNELIENNLELAQKMAYSHAKQFNYNKQDITDQLVSAAYTGLVIAATKYDPDKNKNFAAYAKFYITKEIIDTKYTFGRNVRLPDSVFEDYKKIRAAQAVSDDIEDIVKLTELSKKRIKTVLYQAQAESSLDTPLGDDEHNTIGDMIADTQADSPFDDTTKLRGLVDDKIDQLNEKEIKVINYRYFYDGDMSVGNFAKSIGLTVTQMNKLEKVALRKLKILMSK